MKLTRIEIENFGPYFERHEVDLGVSANAPLIIIHGENERGKTSLANAIRWCLYGTAIGRGALAVPTPRLINSHAKQNHMYNMSVRLEFDHEEVSYVLERQVQASVPPEHDRDLTTHISLRRNGSFEPAQSVERTIREILHPQISRFFLFDGEMLNEYEELLRNPTTSTHAVKQSIEQILGLPSIQRAVPVLEELRRTSERRQRQEVSSQRQNERILADAQQKEEALEAVEQNLLQLQDQLRHIDAEREQLRARLERFGEIQSDLRDLDRIENEIEMADKDAERIKEEIRHQMRANWWMALGPALNREILEAEDGAQDATSRQAEVEALRQELDRLAQGIQSKVCAACGQQLPAAAHASHVAHHAEAAERLQALQANVGDTRSHVERIVALRPFRGDGAHARLVEREVAYRRTRLKRRQLTEEQSTIRDRVRTDYRSEITDIERQLEQCIQSRSAVDRLLVESQNRKREIEAALQRLQAQIRGLPTANRRVAVEASVFGALKGIFESAISDFSDRLRVEVEREAAAIHKSLSTEGGYAGLKINEQYGLSLVNDSGRVIADRSAGSEQIVALALIGALNRCATREAPIVMDTPFGRLDRGHRQRVLQFAPSLGPQVVLLVQSGEIERERDLGAISEKISREFRIERDGASDQSRIVELRER